MVCVDYIVVTYLYCLFLVHGFLTSISLQAWVTLGRAQLNFGEPDSAIESFDRALSIKVC